ncbi:hypothetical protein GCK72_000690 [Caenorhabditis remanei]|uniref:Uncharacterized protein n=1 Tax=Caenorhabditis remanei TaxID=31234 RepID=A0A6A5HRD0_CAERE|nr:hypothetical protein GCK72_000690 [Caenorhabditis remanei]KAF1768877.1 hypothetical protein GCK72_000690 [Caenorhabditis remanei]
MCVNQEEEDGPAEVDGPEEEEEEALAAFFKRCFSMMAHRKVKLTAQLLFLCPGQLLAEAPGTHPRRDTDRAHGCTCRGPPRISADEYCSPRHGQVRYHRVSLCHRHRHLQRNPSTRHHRHRHNLHRLNLYPKSPWRFARIRGARFDEEALAQFSLNFHHYRYWDSDWFWLVDSFAMDVPFHDHDPVLLSMKPVKLHRLYLDCFDVLVVVEFATPPELIFQPIRGLSFPVP